MKLAVVTLFPEMFSAIIGYGITSRAVSHRVVEINFYNPRSYTNDNHQTVDDRPYGGGPGMVMTIEPLRQAILAARDWAGVEDKSGHTNRPKVVYMSPQGRMLNQQVINDFADQAQNLVLVAGRYEGIDERLLEVEIDEEWSIGDYVVSGGELPAMVFMDALMRQLPGVLGHDQSAAQDSFAEGLLDCPHYTRPDDYQGRRVPDVLLSGNHEEIRRWRLKQSLQRTMERRPELIAALSSDKEQRELLLEIRAGKEDQSDKRSDKP